MPIVLLTAKAQEAEKVLGLELGADDYVTKPYSARELRARDQGASAPGHGAAAGHAIGSATPSWISPAASCAARDASSSCRRSSSSCSRLSSRGRAACSRARSCWTTVWGLGHARHRSRRRQPGDEPSQEDRADAGSSAVPRRRCAGSAIASTSRRPMIRSRKCDAGVTFES